MSSTIIRCPNCQKKQDEPCPERCGCGQSLLTHLAARRHAAGTERAEPVPGWGLPGTLGRDDRAGGGGENEW